MIATSQNKKPTKPPRVCRWLSSQPLDAFAAGRGAYLEIEADGECVTYYVTPRIDGGRIVSWTLSRPDTDEEGFESVVAYVLPGDLSGCQCRWTQFHPFAQPCRHRAGLRAALIKIGVQV